MNSIIDKITKSKVISIIILIVLAVLLVSVLVFSTFRFYEILICVVLGLLINVIGRLAFNKPKLKVYEIILLTIVLVLAMYANSH